MWLSKAADLLDKVVRPLSRALYSIGVGVLVVMMLLTASDVTLRYVFNKPITGSFDLTEFMMAIVVGFGLAYCAVKKGHVRIDFVVDRLPRRVQAIIDSITGILGVFFFSMITWQTAVHVKQLWHSGVLSPVMLIPPSPFAALVALGSACLTLVFLSDWLKSLSEAIIK